jgi:hypothetical protein
MPSIWNSRQKQVSILLLFIKQRKLFYVRVIYVLCFRKKMILFEVLF